MIFRQSKRRKLAIVAVAVAAVSAGLGALVYFPVPPANAPTVLVSVDRTLWNRIGLNRLTHVRALRDAGLRPHLVDFEAHEAAAATDLLSGFDALVLGGGGDVDSLIYGSSADPAIDVSRKRDEFELALLAAAERASMPILGLCRGAQLINVHRGGSLADFRADTSRYDDHHRVLSGHPVILDADSRLASIYDQRRLDSVVTYHGQYVKEPGEGVRIVAYAPDGTPEAIEVETGSEFGMLGVQWHAEVLPWDSNQHRLFGALAEAAAAYRAARP